MGFDPTQLKRHCEIIIQSRRIGQFYSYKGDDPKYHIPFFLASLQKFI